MVTIRAAFPAARRRRRLPCQTFLREEQETAITSVTCLATVFQPQLPPPAISLWAAAEMEAVPKICLAIAPPPQHQPFPTLPLAVPVTETALATCYPVAR